MPEPFIPPDLPIDIDWISHLPIIGEANIAVGRYDGILQGIVDPNVLLSPMMVQEAVLSSKIEGTQASLEEVLEYEVSPPATVTPERRDDINEIINYRRATSVAMNLLDERPLNTNIIRELHGILLQSVRGRDKDPGNIRRTQNYIAPNGTSIEEASYVPPPPTMVLDKMSNWESYLHSNERDKLVQIAILKGQFELIHPFRDGNGRIGRMLIPIMMYVKNLLSRPMFYVSAYLEHNREEYYDCLLRLSQNDDWERWIHFFITAVIQQANENSTRAKEILRLYEAMKTDIPEATHSRHAIQTIDLLFGNPIFKTSELIEKTGLSRGRASRMIRELIHSDIIRIAREPRGRKPGVYAFHGLLEIVARP